MTTMSGRRDAPPAGGGASVGAGGGIGGGVPAPGGGAGGVSAGGTAAPQDEQKAASSSTDLPQDGQDLAMVFPLGSIALVSRGPDAYYKVRNGKDGGAAFASGLDALVVGGSPAAGHFGGPFAAGLEMVGTKSNSPSRSPSPSKTKKPTPKPSASH